MTQIKTYSWDNAQVILVGNKCDMEEERVVSAERGRQLADQLGVEFYETSAKENINVKVQSIIYNPYPTTARDNLFPRYAILTGPVYSTARLPNDQLMFPKSCPPLGKTA